MSGRITVVLSITFNGAYHENLKKAYRVFFSCTFWVLNLIERVYIVTESFENVG